MIKSSIWKRFLLQNMQVNKIGIYCWFGSCFMMKSDEIFSSSSLSSLNVPRLKIWISSRVVHRFQDFFKGILLEFAKVAHLYKSGSILGQSESIGVYLILWNLLRHKLWPVENGMFSVTEIGKNKKKTKFENKKKYCRVFLNDNCLRWHLLNLAFRCMFRINAITWSSC